MMPKEDLKNSFGNIAIKIVDSFNPSLMAAISKKKLAQVHDTDHAIPKQPGKQKKLKYRKFTAQD